MLLADVEQEIYGPQGRGRNAKMKRDNDLTRLILLKIEASDNIAKEIELPVENYTDEQVQYHLKLLTEDEVIDARNTSSMGQLSYRPLGLKSKGHDLIETFRDATTWNKTKEKLGPTWRTLSTAGLQAAINALVKGVTG